MKTQFTVPDVAKLEAALIEYCKANSIKVTPNMTDFIRLNFSKIYSLDDIIHYFNVNFESNGVFDDNEKIVEHIQMLWAERPSVNGHAASLERFVQLSKKTREDQTVSLDFEQDAILDLWNLHIVDFLQRGKTFEILKGRITDEEVTNLARSIRIIEITRKY